MTACQRFRGTGARSLQLGAWLALATQAACVSSGRFNDEPIQWQVDDQRDIAEPEATEFYYAASAFDWYVGRRLTRALELRDSNEAKNVNALDEVLNGAWFENRIGVRRVSPAELAVGASSAGPPQLPLEVVRGKPGGKNPGFMAKDKNGRTFVVKFDTKENPEMQTATNTIVNRLFWAIGYHVTNDTVFTFQREDLSIARGAKAKDGLDRSIPFTPEILDEVLSGVPRANDGSYRASASEFVPGVPKGGVLPEGTRPDDANDRVAHENRRELRGLRVFAAWVNHTDIKEDNTLSSYEEHAGRRFLRHYLVDFGEAFGSHAAEKGRYEDGYEHWFDWQAQPAAAFAFGLWVRPWEHLTETPWPSVGAFSAEHFDPDGWREAYPYWPFFETDTRDSYWAAKIVMRFDRKLLWAAVRQGHLSHRAAERYLVEVLYERRSIVGRTYLERVSPLDNFSIDSEQLCAVDLSVHYGLVTSGLVEAIDSSGEVAYDTLVDRNGRVCIPIASDDEYRVYRLRTRRRSTTHPVLQVHFKGGERPRILGIVRLER